MHSRYSALPSEPLALLTGFIFNYCIMENGKRITIISAPKDHGFKNFAEAKKWAKQNIVGTVQQPEIGEVNISRTAIDKYLSQKAVEKSDTKDVHLLALRVMPQIIENSVVGEIHEDKNNIPQLSDIVRLYSAIEINEKLYRVKTTVKRYNDSTIKSKAYSYEVKEIELLDGTHGENASLPRTSNNSITAAKLLQNV